MSETTPTPNNMPGAAQEAPVEPQTEKPGIPTEIKTGKADAPADSGVSGEDAAELARLRAIHKEEQKWEKRAKQNFDDAERWRQLTKQAGGEASKEFDPQAEFQRLREEVTNERTERIRADVARTENVPPKYILGSTEEDMRASAQEYKADTQALIDQALKGRAPAAAPASEVTANGKVAGPGQIQSQDELKNMTPKEIMAADSEGRLDHLKGKV